MDSGKYFADPERESEMLHHMGLCTQILENSLYWSSFLDQMQTPEMLNRIRKFLGGEASVKMVIYGIGNINEEDEDPRLQLSLAILMKKKFSWIGEVEVFDPVISLIESNVITALGFSVLSVNEEGRREATKPTLFFMPHCPLGLYGNLLQANWKLDMLNRVAILGNSFESYVNDQSLYGDPYVALAMGHILAIRQLTKEFKIKTFQDADQAFFSMSWHFFCIDSEEK